MKRLNSIQQDWVVAECRFAGVDERFAREMLDKLCRPYNTSLTRSYSVADYIDIIINAWKAEQDTRQ